MKMEETMNLRAQNPPHIRSRESNQTVMGDTVIAMLPLYAMAFYFYGPRSLALGAVSCLTCISADFVCQLIGRKVPNVRDYSPLITGMIIPLLLPASTRYWIVVAAGLFAICVAKQPFGGIGHNVFNPAAAGVAFAVICWPRSTFQFPVPFDPLPVTGEITARLVASPGRALAMGGVPTTDFMDMLLGNVPGPMGGTNILVLLTCLLFLAVRKTVNLCTTGAFLGGVAITAAIFPRAVMAPFPSILYEVMSGWVMITAVFLINDPVSSPKRRSARLLYGFLAGVVGIVFRHLGKFEDSLLFALLVMNASVYMIELWAEQAAHAFRRKNRELTTSANLSAPDGEDLGDTEG